MNIDSRSIILPSQTNLLVINIKFTVYCCTNIPIVLLTPYWHTYGHGRKFTWNWYAESYRILTLYFYCREIQLFATYVRRPLFLYTSSLLEFWLKYANSLIVLNRLNINILHTFILIKFDCTVFHANICTSWKAKINILLYTNNTVYLPAHIYSTRLENNTKENVQITTNLDGIEVVNNLQTIINASTDDYRNGPHQLTNNRIEALIILETQLATFWTINIDKRDLCSWSVSHRLRHF
jgi:hypothetical protein